MANYSDHYNIDIDVRTKIIEEVVKSNPSANRLIGLAQQEDLFSINDINEYLGDKKLANAITEVIKKQLATSINDIATMVNSANKTINSQVEKISNEKGIQARETALRKAYELQDPNSILSVASMVVDKYRTSPMHTETQNATATENIAYTPLSGLFDFLSATTTAIKNFDEKLNNLKTLPDPNRIQQNTIAVFEDFGFPATKKGNIPTEQILRHSLANPSDKLLPSIVPQIETTPVDPQVSRSMAILLSKFMTKALTTLTSGDIDQAQIQQKGTLSTEKPKFIAGSTRHISTSELKDVNRKSTITDFSPSDTNPFIEMPYNLISLGKIDDTAFKSELNKAKINIDKIMESVQDKIFNFEQQADDIRKAVNDTPEAKMRNLLNTKNTEYFDPLRRSRYLAQTQQELRQEDLSRYDSTDTLSQEEFDTIGIANYNKRLGIKGNTELFKLAAVTKKIISDYLENGDVNQLNKSMESLISQDIISEIERKFDYIKSPNTGYAKHILESYEDIDAKLKGLQNKGFNNLSSTDKKYIDSLFEGYIGNKIKQLFQDAGVSNEPYLDTTADPSRLRNPEFIKSLASYIKSGSEEIPDSIMSDLEKIYNLSKTNSYAKKASRILGHTDWWQSSTQEEGVLEYLKVIKPKLMKQMHPSSLETSARDIKEIMDQTATAEEKLHAVLDVYNRSDYYNNQNFAKVVNSLKGNSKVGLTQSETYSLKLLDKQDNGITSEDIKRIVSGLDVGDMNFPNSGEAIKYIEQNLAQHRLRGLKQAIRNIGGFDKNRFSARNIVQESAFEQFGAQERYENIENEIKQVMSDSSFARERLQADIKIPTVGSTQPWKSITNLSYSDFNALKKKLDVIKTADELQSIVSEYAQSAQKIIETVYQGQYTSMSDIQGLKSLRGKPYILGSKTSAFKAGDKFTNNLAAAERNNAEFFDFIPELEYNRYNETYNEKVLSADSYLDMLTAGDNFSKKEAQRVKREADKYYKNAGNVLSVGGPIGQMGIGEFARKMSSKIGSKIINELGKLYRDERGSYGGDMEEYLRNYLDLEDSSTWTTENIKQIPGFEHIKRTPQFNDYIGNLLRYAKDRYKEPASVKQVYNEGLNTIIGTEGAADLGNFFKENARKQEEILNRTETIDMKTSRYSSSEMMKNIDYISKGGHILDELGSYKNQITSNLSQTKDLLPLLSPEMQSKFRDQISNLNDASLQEYNESVKDVRKYGEIRSDFVKNIKQKAEQSVQLHNEYYAKTGIDSSKGLDQVSNQLIETLSREYNKSIDNESEGLKKIRDDSNKIMQDIKNRAYSHINDTLRNLANQPLAEQIQTDSETFQRNKAEAERQAQWNYTKTQWQFAGEQTINRQNLRRQVIFEQTGQFPSNYFDNPVIREGQAKFSRPWSLTSIENDDLRKILPESETYSGINKKLVEYGQYSQMYRSMISSAVKNDLMTKDEAIQKENLLSKGIEDLKKLINVKGESPTNLSLQISGALEAQSKQLKLSPEVQLASTRNILDSIGKQNVVAEYWQNQYKTSSDTKYNASMVSKFTDAIMSSDLNIVRKMDDIEKIQKAIDTYGLNEAGLKKVMETVDRLKNKNIQGGIQKKLLDQLTQVSKVGEFNDIVEPAVKSYDAFMEKLPATESITPFAAREQNAHRFINMLEQYKARTGKITEEMKNVAKKVADTGPDALTAENAMKELNAVTPNLTSKSMQSQIVGGYLSQESLGGRITSGAKSVANSIQRNFALPGMKGLFDNMLQMTLLGEGFKWMEDIGITGQQYSYLNNMNKMGLWNLNPQDVIATSNRYGTSLESLTELMTFLPGMTGINMSKGNSAQLGINAASSISALLNAIGRDPSTQRRDLADIFEIFANEGAKTPNAQRVLTSLGMSKPYEELLEAAKPLPGETPEERFKRYTEKIDDIFKNRYNVDVLAETNPTFQITKAQNILKNAMGQGWSQLVDTFVSPMAKFFINAFPQNSGAYQGLVTGGELLMGGLGTLTAVSGALSIGGWFNRNLIGNSLVQGQIKKSVLGKTGKPEVGKYQINPELRSVKEPVGLYEWIKSKTGGDIRGMTQYDEDLVNDIANGAAMSDMAVQTEKESKKSVENNKKREESVKKAEESEKKVTKNNDVIVNEQKKTEKINGRWANLNKRLSNIKTKASNFLKNNKKTIAGVAIVATASAVLYEYFKPKEKVYEANDLKNLRQTLIDVVQALDDQSVSIAISDLVKTSEDGKSKLDKLKTVSNVMDSVQKLVDFANSYETFFVENRTVEGIKSKYNLTGSTWTTALSAVGGGIGAIAGGVPTGGIGAFEGGILGAGIGAGVGAVIDDSLATEKARQIRDMLEKWRNNGEQRKMMVETIKLVADVLKDEDFNKTLEGINVDDITAKIEKMSVATEVATAFQRIIEAVDSMQKHTVEIRERAAAKKADAGTKYAQEYLQASGNYWKQAPEKPEIMDMKYIDIAIKGIEQDMKDSVKIINAVADIANNNTEGLGALKELPNIDEVKKGSKSSIRQKMTRAMEILTAMFGSDEKGSGGLVTKIVEATKIISTQGRDGSEVLDKLKPNEKGETPFAKAIQNIVTAISGMDKEIEKLNEMKSFDVKEGEGESPVDRLARMLETLGKAGDILKDHDTSPFDEYIASMTTFREKFEKEITQLQTDIKNYMKELETLKTINPESPGGNQSQNNNTSNTISYQDYVRGKGTIKFTTSIPSTSLGPASVTPLAFNMTNGTKLMRTLSKGFGDDIKPMYNLQALTPQIEEPVTTGGLNGLGEPITSSGASDKPYNTGKQNITINMNGYISKSMLPELKTALFKIVNE